jgi:phage terminase large subunit-like protein
MAELAMRQEILAEDAEEVEGALWKQSVIDDWRLAAAPDLVRIMVAVDPSGSSKTAADEAGIVAAGVSADGHGYLPKDRSRCATPQAWAAAAVTAYHGLGADRIVAESNFGPRW